ncbi:sorbosone dehydrogenase family protein [Hymenobacter sp. ISL-91]|uniref:PQQ-dependent sugar dehydrogenase n=1 Tax=Hymenobacter sp. ISL-91 TaxID=2819151 RepID=UPI001BE8FD29|nr:PQQ-dependent sugar dehydrogenase [Hymenobacter sp. ISL-91]MBT2559021.1 sorbosone dehydrogenase family protein [Hymenobacter sp. ISL-91]
MVKVPFLLATLLTAGFTATAQNDYQQSVRASYEGHIFKPKQVDATDARVAQLKVPAGFTITKFAEKLDKPRMLAVAPNGDVYVSNRDKGTITLLRDSNQDGRADQTRQVAQAEHLHGLAIRDGKLYASAIRELYVADIQKDGSLSPLKRLYDDLPDAGQHPNRTLNFAPDGTLYLSVGSTCNACDEGNKENATLLQMKLDGSGRTVYAQGLRNTIGFGWHPRTGQLFGFDHGIDWLGDEQQREELNEIKQGGNYGWPFVFENGKANLADEPPGGQTHAEYAAKTINPKLLYKAHSAPLGMAFYNGQQFPKEYQNDAIVTMHGSWNRAEPAGYKLVRVHFNEQGQPEKFEDFVTGWLVNDNKEQFGRVCGIAQHADGSLLVSDDATGVVYRVAYAGNGKPAPAGKARKRG